MTVKEAVKVLKQATRIDLAWDGMSVPFDKDNQLMLDAFGDYVVGEITTGVGETEEDEVFEITVALTPLKAGA